MSSGDYRQWAGKYKCCGMTTGYRISKSEKNLSPNVDMKGNGRAGFSKAEETNEKKLTGAIKTLPGRIFEGQFSRFGLGKVEFLDFLVEGCPVHAQDFGRLADVVVRGPKGPRQGLPFRSIPDILYPFFRILR
jgi:hypothetical protein